MVRAISGNNNNDSTTRRRSQFTPMDATLMLPLVRRIVDDIVGLSRSIDAQRERLNAIDALPHTIDQPDYREEISDIRGSLADEQERLDACLNELAALGLETHQPFDGSVDFPAMLNRRQVRLCWRPEDESVQYWHELGQSRKERQKIDPQKFTAETLN